MSVPFVLIDLTSVIGCVTNVSDIHISNEDPTKTLVKILILWFIQKTKLLKLFVSRHKNDHLLSH